ncbi:hypothetical protein NUW54_g11847 [Trametes sanguinea]|uniref:Uncharacterized protein n=1 Tax=Trametes sanguinea TaxID=158606 RepID=A0ACC1N809_9APHY|nr:hypothetical protein NUW54_g11847 [Trametes sanguinea]
MRAYTLTDPIAHTGAVSDWWYRYMQGHRANARTHGCSFRVRGLRQQSLLISRRICRELASPWQNAPVLFFHIRNPDTLASSTVLLRCIHPPAAVVLQLEHFIHFGLLSSLIPAWKNVNSLRMVLASPCQRRPYDRFEVLGQYVAPLLHVPFPTMDGVTSLSITLKSEANTLIMMEDILPVLLPSFPRLRALHLSLSVPRPHGYIPRIWFEQVFSFLHNDSFTFDVLVIGEWVFDRVLHRFYPIDLASDFASHIRRSISLLELDQCAYC